MIRQMLLRAGADETTGRYPFYHRSEVHVADDAPRLFAILDDHRRLAAHMEKPSLMMAGAKMRAATDALNGQAVGSLIRNTRRVLGMTLAVEEIVTERITPLCKIWETRGEPRLLVMGSDRMGFTISANWTRSYLTVFIDYQLSRHGFARAFGVIFGRVYAAWCTRRIGDDAVSAFSDAATMQ